MVISSGSTRKTGGILVTFGKTDVGANRYTTSTTQARKSLFQCPAVGRLQTLSIYIETSALVTGDIDIGIYDGLVLLGSKTQTVPVNSAQWFDIDFSDLLIDVTAKTYGLGFKPHRASMELFYAVAVANSSQYDNVLAGSHIPNPFVVDGQLTSLFSIHADVLT